jgi:hypothetical protein
MAVPMLRRSLSMTRETQTEFSAAGCQGEGMPGAFINHHSGRVSVVDLFLYRSCWGRSQTRRCVAPPANC